MLGVVLFVLVVLALAVWSGYLGIVAVVVIGIALPAGFVYALPAGATAPKARRKKARSYRERPHRRWEGRPSGPREGVHPPEAEEGRFFRSVTRQAREREERPTEPPREDERPTATPERWAISRRLREMSDEEFERLVAHHLAERGYGVATTPGSGGRGANLIVAAADHRRISVLLKRQNEPLGEGAVREALGGRAFYGTYEAWLVTDNAFTRGALYEAKKRKGGGVRLIDGDELAGWLEKLPELLEDEA